MRWAYPATSNGEYQQKEHNSTGLKGQSIGNFMTFEDSTKYVYMSKFIVSITFFNGFVRVDMNASFLETNS